MSDYSIIKDVGNTLITLLWDHIETDTRIYDEVLGTKTEITLASPEKLEISTQNTQPTDKKLSLYLFRILENPFLKNREMQTNGPRQLNDVPLTLDLFYLVTPDTGDIESDQLLLGKVMQVFHDNAIIGGSLLEGDALRGSFEKLRLQLYPLPFEEAINLWQSFSARSFQLSICYQVTPVSIDSARQEKTQRVVEKDDRYNRKPDPKRRDDNV